MDTRTKPTDQCRICLNENIDLYPCCSNSQNEYCQLCWSNQFSMIIQQGKLSLLLRQELNCDNCNQLIEWHCLPKEIQMKIHNILLTIPKTKYPISIEEFHYSYKNSNELRHCLTNEKFIFLTQRHYNLLGNCIDKYIQFLIKNDPWNYNEIWLPIKDENRNDDDDHHDQVNIFTSKDFSTNQNGCLILIQGSGVVRAGQWARSCCINESLDIGGMQPMFEIGM